MSAGLSINREVIGKLEKKKKKKNLQALLQNHGISISWCEEIVT